jgi:hypothetical protein
MSTTILTAIFLRVLAKKKLAGNLGLDPLRIGGANDGPRPPPHPQER